MTPPGLNLRVGIDVGGTFTDVVALDAVTREPVARVKVPTSHDAPGGIAEGIVAGIEGLLRDPQVASGRIAFIAHSTTQATNALLEGDLARVGVLGLLDEMAWLARRHMRFAPLVLGASARFAPAFEFVRGDDPAAMRAAIERLIAQGVQALAASESFGVDRPQREAAAVEMAHRLGIDATSGHDVSTAYGLRARTRTAALNAAILPRMLRTARVTAQAVERAAIPAPLMVMRSDGGVMDVREVERRPILTMLSGPAAGIAGALLHERLSDGIFIEVGGTSSDCSAIRNGRPQMRPARVGGYRTMLRTLDVRTLGIGGGSMLRIEGNAVAGAGPRSAHIAGCAYAAFTDPARLDGARLECDGESYAVFVTRDGVRIAPTLTCAANLLGIVPAGAFARGNETAARLAFELLADELGGDAVELARRSLEYAALELRATVEALIADYAIDPQHAVLVGGGGGCGAILPPLAETMKLPYRIARDAEVIAPIGVALALVRDVVERTIASPTPEEIARIRREAADRVVAAGASPERIVVEVEIDAHRSRVTAIASGATELAEDAGARCSAGERRAIAAQSLGCEASQLESVELTAALDGYEQRTESGGFGARHSMRRLRVVNERGIVRASLTDYGLARATAESLPSSLREIVENATQFGDVGRALPALYLLHGARIAAFEGLSSAEQAVALAREELEGCAAVEPVVVLLEPRAA